MKKFLFVLVSLVMSLSMFSQSNDWTMVDCDFIKRLSFDELALVEMQSTKKLTEGGLLINYKDFGSAGSLCDISIIAKGKDKTTGKILTIFDGNTYSHFEDVLVFYNSHDKTIVIKNKFDELICAILYDKDSGIHALYIEDFTNFVNQIPNETSQSKTKKSYKRRK